jgi:hypothetical protein
MRKLHLGKLAAIFVASFTPAAWAVVSESVNAGHVGTDIIMKAVVAGIGSSIVAVSALLMNAYKEPVE